MVEAFNTIIQERRNQAESCITIEASERTEKLEIHPAIEGSGLAFFGTYLGYIFESNFGSEFRVLLRRKNLTNQTFFTMFHAYTLLYTTLIDYNFACDAKAPLLHYIAFISKVNAVDAVNTRQHMNFHTLSTLQFRMLLKIFSKVNTLTFERHEW